MAVGRGRVGTVSEDRRSGGPTPEAIEALVRAIEAREATEPNVEDAGARAEPPTTRGPERGSAVRRRSAAADATGRGRTTPYRAPGGPPTTGAPIPGLVGRQVWEASLVEEAERQQRYARPLAIILAELDGQEPEPTAMGTAMIARTAPRCAAVLLALARASDRVTRLSGTRFGVLLLEADEDAAAAYAERAIAACEPWVATGAFEMRLSVGWAVARGPDELVSALRSAEEHLRGEDEG